MRVTYRKANNKDYWTKRWADIPADQPMQNHNAYPLKYAELTGMHMQWFQNINYEFAAFAYPTKKHGTWGMAITNLHTDDIQRRTDDTAVKTRARDRPMA